METQNDPNGIRIETKYHYSIENTEFYQKLRELFMNTVTEHTCAADEGQNYDEKIDGLYVSGKEEVAMFMAVWAYRNLKEAWEAGWRTREKSQGKNKEAIILKKKNDWETYKVTIINDIISLNPHKQSKL